MELSLLIIKEKINEIVIDYRLPSSCNLMNLQRPVFYSGEKQLSSNTLYISSAENLPLDIEFQKGSALICISRPVQNYLNNDLNILVIDKSVNILDLSNRVHLIYDFFESWDLNVQKSIREHKSLQYLLDITEPVFGNGITIMNHDYYIVARTSLTLSFNLNEEIKTDEFGRLQPNQVNTFKNDINYQKIKNEKKAFIYPANILPYRTLCKNIFLNDEFIYRIVICENMHQFSESDTQLLEYLAKYLIEDSEYLVAVDRNENIDLINLLENILSGNAYNSAAFEKELKRIGWSQNDMYCFTCVLPSDQDIYNETLTYFCNKIMHDFKDSFAFIKENKIIIIFNLHYMDKKEKEYFMKFNRFVKDGNFKVGYSNYSKGLDNLKEYVYESEIALEIGSKAQPNRWSYKYCDCVLTYILNKITEELPAVYLNSPVLSRLKDYDCENNSEYVDTLRTYLKNNMNAVQTAKDLCIHRGTIVYRLERIKEIGKIDFNDSDELLHLYISLRISSK